MKDDSSPTTKKNLEQKFESGQDALDYFEPKSAKVIKPTITRFGRCYELAALFQIEHRDWTLVHGRLVSPFPDTKHQTIDHAWLERNGIAYDPTLDRYLPMQFFDSLFEPVRLFTYTIIETGRKLIEHEHFGPWDYSDRAETATTDWLNFGKEKFGPTAPAPPAE